MLKCRYGGWPPVLLSWLSVWAWFPQDGKEAITTEWPSRLERLRRDAAPGDVHINYRHIPTAAARDGDGVLRANLGSKTWRQSQPEGQAASTCTGIAHHWTPARACRWTLAEKAVAEDGWDRALCNDLRSPARRRSTLPNLLVALFNEISLHDCVVTGVPTQIQTF